MTNFEWLDATDLEPGESDATVDDVEVYVPSGVLKHVLIENDHSPDELGLFPRDDADEILEGQWLVATGRESFVDLEAMR